MEVNVKEVTSFKSSLTGTDGNTNVDGTVSVSNKVLNNIDKGAVTDSKGNQLATWAWFGSLNMSYAEGVDAEAMTLVLGAVNSFIGYCKENAANLLNLTNK